MPDKQTSQLNKQSLSEAADYIENQIIKFNAAPQAKEFLNVLGSFFERHSELERSQPDLYARLRKDETQLRWVALTLISEAEVLDLMENHFTVQFDIPYFDLWVKTRAHLGGLILFADRDKLKNKIRDVLLRNREILTSSGVVFDTKEKRGTVQNWLLDYHDKVGTGLVDTLKLTQYLNNSQNAAGLSKKDKERVAALIHYYEKLKRSSFTIDGMEETFLIEDEKGHTWVLQEGQAEDIDSNKELQKWIEEAQKVGAWSEEQLKIKNEKLKIDDRTDAKSPQDLKSISLSPQNPILAAFNALPIPLDQIQAKMADLQARMSAQPKILEQILGNSERVKDKAYVVAALMLAVRRKGSEPADSDGSEPFFPSRIRDILEQKLGWSAEDSAKIGIRIANILGEKGWAHYHRERGKFEWAI